MGLPTGYEIETVWRSVGEGLTDELVAFWTGHGALNESQAQERAPQVVCVLRDSGGAIAGVNSVYRDSVPVVGDRTFWIYRTFAPGDEAGSAAEEMLAAARDRLAREFNEADDSDRGPIGLCVIARPEMAGPRTEATWPTSELVLAGYTPEGAQVRIRYFEWWARIL